MKEFKRSFLFYLNFFLLVLATLMGFGLLRDSKIYYAFIVFIITDFVCLYLITKSSKHKKLKIQKGDFFVLKQKASANNIFYEFLQIGAIIFLNYFFLSVSFKDPSTLWIILINPISTFFNVSLILRYINDGIGEAIVAKDKSITWPNRKGETKYSEIDYVVLDKNKNLRIVKHYFPKKDMFNLNKYEHMRQADFLEFLVNKGIDLRINEVIKSA